MSSHAKAPSAGSIWTIAAALALALAFLAMTATSAFAAFGHPVLRTFSTGPNTRPISVATDDAGNVYVLDQEAQRIDKFDSNGNRLPFAGVQGYIGETALTGSGEGPFQIDGPPLSTIAVDSSAGPTHGYIYAGINDSSGHSEVLVFEPNGTYKGRLGEKLAKPLDCGIAVDPASGTVYRAISGNFEIPPSTLRFPASTGNPKNTKSNGQLANVPLCGLAVDSSGAAYGIFFGSGRKFDASQFETSPGQSLEFPVGPQAKALAVDSSNGDIYVNESSRLVRFNAAGAQQGAAFGSLNGSWGISVNAGGDVLATDAGGGVFVYGSGEVELPSATTGGSSNLTTSSADVEGAVDPDGAGDVTGCEVRYGEDSGYSLGSVPCTPGAPISSPTSVSAHLTGLVSGTTYHYRVFATNANGTQMAAEEQTFTTPPALEYVGTLGPSEVHKDSAALGGYYAGDGTEAHYFFEWGATTAYGHTTPVPPGGSAGNGSGFQEVAPVSISGLHGGTRYHYRLVVSTAAGTMRGQDESFTTAEAVTNLTTEAPTSITDTGAELNGSFEGDGTYETHYFFEWGLTTNYGNVTPSGSVPAGSEKVNLPPTAITGLARGATYHYRLVASNAIGISIGADVTFKAAEAPIVGGVDARNLQATSAELIGQINPRSGHTTYRFEWGPTNSYGHLTPVPDGDLGSGTEAVPVSAQLSELTPGVTYHFRLLATNPYGTVSSPDQSFGFYPPNCPNSQLRQETHANSLPDCRAYELVTPSFANGATIMPGNGPNTGLATSPSRLAFGKSFTDFLPSESEKPPNSVSDLYIATRTDTGWQQRYMGLPSTETTEMAAPPENFVPDAAQGLFPGFNLFGTQVSPQMDRAVDYARGWAFGTQLLGHHSNAPYVWNSTTGALLERWPTNLGQVPGGDDFIGVPQASPDFSHFVFSSNLVFSDDGTGEASEQSIYTGGFSGGPVFPPKASVYDNDLKTGTVKLASLKSDNQTQFQGYVYSISNDGSHILMGETSNRGYVGNPDGTNASPRRIPRVPVSLTGPLYLRVGGVHTYEIAPGRQIRYVGGTADGKTVYLTSDEQLTVDDHDTSTDLFVWHQSEPNSLTRVSVGSNGEAGNSDDCEVSWTTGCGVKTIEFYPYAGGPGNDGGNTVTDTAIASESGDIYFESPEQLDGVKGEAGKENLYLYREGTVRFVATMGTEPTCYLVPGGGGGPTCSPTPVARMQVTPDGQHMALVTRSHLTGYDSGTTAEMYTYEPGSGRINCASCRPDGQPPAPNTSLITHDTLASQNGLFQANDGRVFFFTWDPLVSRDTDEVGDVYEYTEGKPQLISAGLGEESGLLGGIQGTQAKSGLVSVSANGTDVYFATTDSLVSQDHNGATLKIYDARTGGGFPAEQPPLDCEAADECHGAGASAPTLPPDRTSANLGAKPKPKAHKKHRAKKHKKARHGKHTKHKKKRAGKAKRGAGKAKRGGKHNG